MNKKVFVRIFLTILFAVFVFVPLKEVLIRLNIVVFYQTDNWVIIEKSDNPINDKILSVKANIENRYNNYFPFYNKINDLYFNSIINVDSLYLDNVYLKDNNDLDHLFYNKSNDYFYLTNRYSSQELDNRLEEQASFYNDINNKYPDIKLALYVPLRYEYTKVGNINNNHDRVLKFTNKLNTSIKYKLFDSDTLEDYLKYYYRTDHHYNSYGAEKAYLEILEMYDIDNKLDIKHNMIKDKYHGSMAKSTLLQRTSDELSVMDIPNTLRVNINDEDFKPLEIPDKSNPFYDYYVKYFNGCYDEVIYESDNNYGRNLLIIGDSMAWQLDYLLAYNFDTTIIVNTKYGKWLKNDLILSEYIKEHNITHILFLREAKNLIFDVDNFHVDKKVVR